MFKLKRKKPKISLRLSFGVQAERLELSHLAALDPKSSVSTNSTTPAFWTANINNSFNIQIGFK